MQVRVLSTLQNGEEALVDEHVLCKHEVVDSSSIFSTKWKIRLAGFKALALQARDHWFESNIFYTLSLSVTVNTLGFGPSNWGSNP